MADEERNVLTELNELQQRFSQVEQALLQLLRLQKHLHSEGKVAYYD